MVQSRVAFLSMKICLLILLSLLCLWGCEREQPPQSQESISSAASQESSLPEAESSEEEISLPEKQSLVLLYEYYITAEATADGILYRYTYLFDEEGKVFNAIAMITYPSEEAASTEYLDLLMAEYPNVELEGNSLTFSFPKKQCPYYGITYTALPYLLKEESIYVVTDSYLPQPEDESSTD